MYPETDVLPVCIRRENWQSIQVPELLTVKAARFSEELRLDPEVARQIAFSKYLPLFEHALSAGISANLASRTLLSTMKELSREGIPVGRISENEILDILRSIEDGKAAKEAIPGILEKVAGGSTVETAISECAPAITRDELEAIVARIVCEKHEFVSQKGMGALGPLMGVVMKEVRGSADGKLVSELLKLEIDKVI